LVVVISLHEMVFCRQIYHLASTSSLSVLQASFTYGSCITADILLMMT